MYSLGLHPIGFNLTFTDLPPNRPDHGLDITRIYDGLRIKGRRLGLWLTLMGSLLAIQLFFAEPMPEDEAGVCKVAALFSLLMFLFLDDWMLAALLAFMACYLGWQSLTSGVLSAGIAIVAVGISPVIAFLTAVSLSAPTCCGCMPDWSSDGPFPRRRCHC